MAAPGARSTARSTARPGPRIGPARLPPYDEAVIEVVAAVPAGRATTYGDVAAAMRDSGWGGGPRTVGSVMRRQGGAVAWWRVVRADGGLPVSGPHEALARHRAEGTPLTGPPDARRVDLRRARAVLPPAPPPSAGREGGDTGGEGDGTELDPPQPGPDLERDAKRLLRGVQEAAGLGPGARVVSGGRGCLLP